MPDELNRSHKLVIVAAGLDASTERIVNYLAEDYGMDIDVVFFRVFQDEDREYLTRAWLTAPDSVETTWQDSGSGATRQWNGEFYASFGEGPHRRWNDARKFGFISAGGGSWYVNSLQQLEPGNRVWLCIPAQGYVGVCKVTRPVVRFDEFKVQVTDGSEVPLTTQTVEAPDLFDPDHGEHLVAVEWIKTVSSEEAVWEKGVFANQNSVARPRAKSWDYTIERLKKKFGVA